MPLRFRPRLAAAAQGPASDDDALAATCQCEHTQSLSGQHDGTGTNAADVAARRLTDLPAELHLMIVKHLTYPDALSLKHTNRYFYSFVDTGVRLKVEWLMARRRLHLDCPNNTRCDLGSDLRFCRGSVPLLMKRRREHMECESRPGLGCLIYGTEACQHKRRPQGSRWARWMRRQLTVEIRWVLLGIVPVLLVATWMGELVGLL